MRADWEREALAAVEAATAERVLTHQEMVTVALDAVEPLVREVAVKRENALAQWCREDECQSIIGEVMLGDDGTGYWETDALVEMLRGRHE